MKKTLLFSVMTVLTVSAFAQPDKNYVDEVKTSKRIEADTSKKKDWKMGGALAIAFNQQTSSYWVGVTESYSLSLGVLADLYANYAKNKSVVDNTLKMNYSVLNNQSQGIRKTSDFIDLYSKYGYQLNDSATLFASLLVNGRTQFTNGYDYSQTPKRRTSGFFAPATVLVTPGLEWKPVPYFSVFASPAAARWVIVSNDPYSYTGSTPDEKPISELYGVDATKKFNFQFGAFVSANFNKEILKNVVYSSRLDFYSNYLEKPGNIDIFWTNNLLFKVNKWLALTYQWNIAYDDDFVPEGKTGPRTQFLGNLGIGVTAKF
jgi:hypothetical protein